MITNHRSITNLVVEAGGNWRGMEDHNIDSVVAHFRGQRGAKGRKKGLGCSVQDRERVRDSSGRGGREHDTTLELFIQLQEYIQVCYY